MRTLLSAMAATSKQDPRRSAQTLRTGPTSPDFFASLGAIFGARFRKRRCILEVTSHIARARLSLPVLTGRSTEHAAQIPCCDPRFADARCAGITRTRRRHRQRLDEGHLLTALSGGGTVTFSCSGTITLTAEITIAADTILDGSGQAVTISGNHAVRVFAVNEGVTPA